MSSFNPLTESALPTTFFVRSKAAQGLVVTSTLTNTVGGKALLDQNQATQLFTSAPSADPKYVSLICEQPKLALTANLDGSVTLTPLDPAKLTQQWAWQADGSLLTAAFGTSGCLTLQQVGGGYSYKLLPLAAGNVNQQFEALKKTSFYYLRNAFTGLFLTGSQQSKAEWKPLGTAYTDYQQWGMTAEGFLVCRATAQVLQLSNPTPSSGLALNLGTSVDAGPGAAYQYFIWDDLVDRIYSGADKTLVITGGGSLMTVVVQTIDYDNDNQVMELLSPYQIFSLQCGGMVNNYYPWLDRTNNNATSSPTSTGAPSQQFLNSGYGEMISVQDGLVLQNMGEGQQAQFVDRNGRPFGDKAISFVYNTAWSTLPNYGAVLANDKSGFGLINMGGGAWGTPVMWPLTNPTGGNQVWRVQSMPGT